MEKVPSKSVVLGKKWVEGVGFKGEGEWGGLRHAVNDSIRGGVSSEHWEAIFDDGLAWHAHTQVAPAAPSRHDGSPNGRASPRW